MSSHSSTDISLSATTIDMSSCNGPQSAPPTPESTRKLKHEFIYTDGDGNNIDQDGNVVSRPLPEPEVNQERPIDYRRRLKSLVGMDETGIEAYPGEEDEDGWVSALPSVTARKQAYLEKEIDRMQNAPNTHEYVERTTKTLKAHRDAISVVGWHLTPVISCRICDNTMCYDCLNTTKEAVMRLSDIVRHYHL